MPGPEMVQLDPAQKQAPAAVEAFDRRQIILQAKQEVNLLLEKSKSVINTDKAKLENLQVVSSFTVTARPGHEKETYDIYLTEVCHANRLLVKENANFDIQLKETAPGKLYIVCGIYEEREPKVVQSEEKTGGNETLSVIARTEERTSQAAQISEKQELPQNERIPLILSAEDLRKLAISPEELKKLDPDALTEAQWSVLLKLFKQATRNEHGAGYTFESLFPSQKIEIVRSVLAAVKEESANNLEFSIKYEENEGQAKYDVKKAAETLSSQHGDCDDLALLYIACIKRLEHDNLLKVDGIRLAVVGYYDPKQEKQEESNIRGHANVLHSTMTTKDEKNPKTTTYLVDLTYHSSSVDLGLQANEITRGNSDLKQKYLDYLNAGRREKDKIKPELFELRLYNGYDGAQAYYCETKGAYLRAELNDMTVAASKLREGGHFGEAEKESVSLETKLKELYDLTSKGLKQAQESGSDYGKMLVILADVCHTRSMNLTNHGSALANLANDEKDPAIQEKMRERVKADNADASIMRDEYFSSYQMATNLDGQDSYTLNSVADHLRFNRDADSLPIAESKIKEAIEKARFTPEFYRTYWNIMVLEGKADEAKNALDVYKATLTTLGVKVNAEKNDAISVINELIGK